MCDYAENIAAAEQGDLRRQAEAILSPGTIVGFENRRYFIGENSEWYVLTKTGRVEEVEQYSVKDYLDTKANIVRVTQHFKVLSAPPN